MSELPEWGGHTPRDRASVWYLGRWAGVAAYLLILALVLPLIIIAVR